MTTKKSNFIIWFVIILAIVGILCFIVFDVEKNFSNNDFKEVDFLINGESVNLVDGVNEEETVPGSASKTITRYFGNDFITDLNSDGLDDVVFLITQETGGSGTFFYVVAALNTENGYIGSDGYFLGDRIAPQTIEDSPNPRHIDVVVINYADRAEGQPMTTVPSVGKSVYLKLDTAAMQWGIVEPDFEGESAMR